VKRINARNQQKTDPKRRGLAGGGEWLGPCQEAELRWGEREDAEERMGSGGGLFRAGVMRSRVAKDDFILPMRFSVRCAGSCENERCPALTECHSCLASYFGDHAPDLAD
jgi:hypothetical protein